MHAGVELRFSHLHLVEVDLPLTADDLVWLFPRVVGGAFGELLVRLLK